MSTARVAHDRTRNGIVSGARRARPSSLGGNAMEIVYCERCGRIVPPSEAAGGDIIRTADGAICPACVKTMPAAERDALRAPSRATPRPSRKQSSTRAGRHQPAASRRAPMLALVIAGTFCGLAAGITATLALFGGEPDPPPAVARPAAPSPVLPAPVSPVDANEPDVSPWSTTPAEPAPVAATAVDTPDAIEPVATAAPETVEAPAEPEPVARPEPMPAAPEPPPAESAPSTPAAPPPVRQSPPPTKMPAPAPKKIAVAAGSYLPGLLGEYFHGKRPAPDSLVSRRVDAAIDFAWRGSPAPNVREDDYTVRWTGELRVPEAGRYEFLLRYDDAIALSVGGTQVFDSHGKPKPKAPLAVELEAGWLPISIRHYESRGYASVHIEWGRAGEVRRLLGGDDVRVASLLAAGASAPAPSAPRADRRYVAGLLGRYYHAHKPDPDHLEFERVDARLSFKWWDGPSPALKDYRCVQWTGELEIPEDGSYEFIRSHNRVKIVVNGTLLLEARKDNALRAAADLEKGWVPIELILSDGGHTDVEVRWRGPGVEEQVLADTTTRTSAILAAGAGAVVSSGGGQGYVAGLLGEYYRTARGSDEPVLRRVDTLINFKWPPGPHDELEKGRYVVWKGELRVPADGPYELEPWTRDRARLKIEGRIVYDSFAGDPKASSVTVDLKKGWVPIELNYGAGGMTEMYFRWKGPGFDRKFVGAEDTRTPALLAAGAGSTTVAYVDGMTARPEKDGYLSNPQLLHFISTKYDAKKVTAKTLVSIGGTVAAGRAFDATLAEALGDDYAFASKRGLAGRGAPAKAVLLSLANSLDREKPEIARIAFDVVDRRTGAPAVDESTLTAIVNACLARGIVPVLFTAFMPPQRRDEARKLINDHNVLVLKTAEKLKVPCVDAHAILNRDPALLAKYFTTSGALRHRGLKAVNARFLTLYRVIEKTVMGRDVKIPAAGPAAPADERGTPGPSAAAGGTGAALVANGGFESRSPHTSFATGWAPHQWGARGAQYSARLDRTNPRGGDNAVVVRALGEGAKPGVFAQVALDPGTYRITYWACAEVGSSAQVLARFGDVELPTHTVPEDWTAFTDTFEVKDKRVRVSVGVCTTTGKVRVWFDDVELVRVR